MWVDQRLRIYENLRSESICFSESCGSLLDTNLLQGSNVETSKTSETSKPDWAPDRHGDGKPRRRAAAPPRRRSTQIWAWRSVRLLIPFLMCSSCVPPLHLRNTCFIMFPHLNKHQQIQQAAWHHEFAGIRIVRSWWIKIPMLNPDTAPFSWRDFNGYFLLLEKWRPWSQASTQWVGPCCNSVVVWFVMCLPVITICCYILWPLAWPNAHRNLSYVRS